jgi:hypothetical protein
MAFITADRVRDTSTTAGSSSFSVSGTAPTGYRTFSAVLSVSDTFYYSIQHQTLNEWEVGLGTYSSANTFQRTTIYSSSNAGSAVTFSAGTKDVFITMAAARSPQLDASGNSSISGTQVMGSSFLRNRIINGNMVVNQRSATATAGETFTVDRWKFIKGNDATESVAQSTDAPTGFWYSLRDTVSVADTSIGAAQYSGFKQIIEGPNIADWAFGTASAKSLTVSFWVRSTVTGLYTASISNYAETRICPFNYTINASNTWEYKTATISGDTSGTWVTTTGAGAASIFFYSALGSNYSGGTAGVWNATGGYGSGGASLVNGLNAAGNIFAITGVQLEVGTAATPYENKIYSDQLAQCQRYCYVCVPSSVSGQNSIIGVGTAYSTTSAFITLPFPVVLRAVPTLSYTGALGNFYGMYVGAVTYSALNAMSINGFTNCQVAFVAIGYGAIASAGQAINLISDSTKAGYLIFSSEL